MNIHKQQAIYSDLQWPILPQFVWAELSSWQAEGAASPMRPKRPQIISNLGGRPAHRPTPTSIYIFHGSDSDLFNGKVWLSTIDTEHHPFIRQYQLFDIWYYILSNAGLMQDVILLHGICWTDSWSFLNDHQSQIEPGSSRSVATARAKRRSEKCEGLGTKRWRLSRAKPGSQVPENVGMGWEKWNVIRSKPVCKYLQVIVMLVHSYQVLHVYYHQHVSTCFIMLQVNYRRVFKAAAILPRCNGSTSCDSPSTAQIVEPMPNLHIDQYRLI